MRQECIDKLKQINLPIYIWGSGEIASLAKKSLNKEGIDIEGFVIDEKYIKSECDLTKDKVIALGKPYILVKGWGCGHNPGPDNTSGGMLCIHSNKEKKL